MNYGENNVTLSLHFVYFQLFLGAKNDLFFAMRIYDHKTLFF